MAYLFFGTNLKLHGNELEIEKMQVVGCKLWALTTVNNPRIIKEQLPIKQFKY